MWSRLTKGGTYGTKTAAAALEMFPGRARGYGVGCQLVLTQTGDLFLLGEAGVTALASNRATDS